MWGADKVWHDVHGSGISRRTFFGSVSKVSSPCCWRNASVRKSMAFIARCAGRKRKDLGEYVKMRMGSGAHQSTQERPR